MTPMIQDRHLSSDSFQHGQVYRSNGNTFFLTIHLRYDLAPRIYYLLEAGGRGNIVNTGPLNSSTGDKKDMEELGKNGIQG